MFNASIWGRVDGYCLNKLVWPWETEVVQSHYLAAIGKPDIHWCVLSNNYILFLGDDIRIINIVLKQMIQDMLVKVYLHVIKTYDFSWAFFPNILEYFSRVDYFHPCHIFVIMKKW